MSNRFVSELFSEGKVDPLIAMCVRKLGFCRDSGCRIGLDLDNKPFATLIPKKCFDGVRWIVTQRVIDDMQYNINNMPPQVLSVNPIILDWCCKLKIEKE